MEVYKKNTQNKEYRLSVKDIIENTITTFILILFVVIAGMLFYQRVFTPEKIPDIFGYKLFIIMDNNMEESLKDGDLVVIKNINTNNLKKEDIVAFRNENNTITIHKIKEIKELKNHSKSFIMNIKAGELLEDITEEKIEGILIKKIQKIGALLLFVQKPIVTLIGIIIILVIGSIAYFIAAKLDEKDLMEAA